MNHAAKASNGWGDGWRADCAQCGWVGRRVSNETAAQRSAKRHNERETANDRRIHTFLYGSKKPFTPKGPAMTETTTKHRMRWFVYSGGYSQPLAKLAHTANMRGHWPGWDAECSCGWKSATGGATKGYVKQQVWYHKWQAANDA